MRKKQRSQNRYKCGNEQVKDTKDKECLVTDNYNIEVIKVLGYFNLFECGTTFFNNIDGTYKRACMAHAKEKSCFGNV